MVLYYVTSINATQNGGVGAEFAAHYLLAFEY